jgi:hypothetical protein
MKDARGRWRDRNQRATPRGSRQYAQTRLKTHRIRDTGPGTPGAFTKLDTTATKQPCSGY